MDNSQSLKAAAYNSNPQNLVSPPTFGPQQNPYASPFYTGHPSLNKQSATGQSAQSSGYSYYNHVQPGKP
jgi:hypothetical protein